MVEGKNDRAFFRYFFPVYNLKPAIIKPVKDIRINIEQQIAKGEPFDIIPGHKKDLQVKLNNFFELAEGALNC